MKKRVREYVVMLFVFGLILVTLGIVNAQQCSQTYGAIGDDWVYSMQQTKNGDYIVGGSSDSFGVENGNFWLSKLNKIDEIPNFTLLAMSDASITDAPIAGNNASITPSESTATISDTSVTPIRLCGYIPPQPPPAPVSSVPTLTEWGMIIFSLLLAATAIFVLRKRTV